MHASTGQWHDQRSVNSFAWAIATSKRAIRIAILEYSGRSSRLKHVWAKGYMGSPPSFGPILKSVKPAAGRRELPVTNL